MLYVLDSRPQDIQAESDWRDRSKSQARSQDTSYLEAPLHSRLQRTDDATVLGTSGSVLSEGQSEGQDQMAPGAWVSISWAPYPVRSKEDIAVTREFELTTSRDMISFIAVRSTAMPENIIRKVLWQSLLALHHLHTAIEDRPGVVHRALSPEKRESKREARGSDA
jgi:hypothetical protein